MNAQQARRVLDRLVGYELSPILWKKIKTGLSAGRVQSVAVRLVVEREREISDFKVKSSYKVNAVFDLGKGKNLVAELSERFDNEQEALEFLQSCVGAKFTINDLQTKPSKTFARHLRLLRQPCNKKRHESLASLLYKPWLWHKSSMNKVRSVTCLLTL